MNKKRQKTVKKLESHKTITLPKSEYFFRMRTTYAQIIINMLTIILSLFNIIILDFSEKIFYFCGNIFNSAIIFATQLFFPKLCYA